MKTKDIIPLMGDVLSTRHNPDPDGCHLYLWVTNNFLKDGLAVMDALDFRFITMRTWAKDRIGLGQYWRGQTEHVLFGVMGKLPAAVRTESTLIGKGLVKRGRHSAKPQVFFDEVERVSPGPRLELFARQPREGWTVWGNEVGP
jgi:N6-adenosine-specific RNA methylase IME4